jgi:hypothetical protein
MTKAQTLAALKNQLDSFYSLEQVIQIIEGIDPEVIAEKKVKLTPELISDITYKIEGVLAFNSSDLVDLESAEFEIDYDNKIQLTNANINLDITMEHIEAILEKFTDDNAEEA